MILITIVMLSDWILENLMKRDSICQNGRQVLCFLYESGSSGTPWEAIHTTSKESEPMPAVKSSSEKLYLGGIK